MFLRHRYVFGTAVAVVVVAASLHHVIVLLALLSAVHPVTVPVPVPAMGYVCLYRCSFKKVLLHFVVVVIVVIVAVVVLFGPEAGWSLGLQTAAGNVAVSKSRFTVLYASYECNQQTATAFPQCRIQRLNKSVHTKINIES